MNLPEQAHLVLRSNINLCCDDKFKVTNEDVDWFQTNLGIKNSKSSFISFYTIVAFPPSGNGAELLPLESIMHNANLDTEEFPEGIGKRFIRLTSFEGEGAYYLDAETDRVFDIGWGEEEKMINGQHPAMAKSFYDFLEKYYEWNQKDTHS